MKKTTMILVFIALAIVILNGCTTGEAKGGVKPPAEDYVTQAEMDAYLAEIDNTITELHTRIDGKVETTQVSQMIDERFNPTNVFDMINARCSTYDISLSDSGWDSNGDGYTTGNEVCDQTNTICILSILEFDNGGTAGSGLEPVTCNQRHPIDNISTNPIDILDVWCCDGRPFDS